MTQPTLAQLLMPVIAKLNEAERQTLKQYLTQVKHWVDFAKSAQAEAQKSKGKNEYTQSYEGFQQSFMVAMHEMNAWLAGKKVHIEPRLIWPKEIPYSETLELQPRLGKSRELEIPVEKRVKGAEQPLKMGAVLKKMKEAEKRLGAGKKVRRKKPFR